MATLAERQRLAALKSILLGVAIALVPLATPQVLKVVPTLATAVKGLTPILGPVLPWLAWVCWAIAALYLWQGLDKLLRSRQGRPSASARILPALMPLQQQGWRFENNPSAAKNGTDPQTIATSPQGKAFCIVIKSERGRIGSDGRTVYRLVDQTQNPFPTDFIDQTKQRAARAQQRLQLSHVVPVLAFSDAILAIEQNPVLGVYVVQMDDLRRSLLQLN